MKGLVLSSLFLYGMIESATAQSYNGLLLEKISLTSPTQFSHFFPTSHPLTFAPSKVSLHLEESVRFNVFNPLHTMASPPDDDLQAQFCADQAGGEWITHYGMSLITTLGMQYILESRFEMPRRWAFVLSALSGLGIGFAKEYHDWKNTAENCFRCEDLWASSIGVLSGAVVIFTF